MDWFLYDKDLRHKRVTDKITIRDHGTIIWTGITYVRKFLVICATLFAGALLFKMLKYSKVMFNIFGISRAKEIVESWLVYVYKFS